MSRTSFAQKSLPLLLLSLALTPAVAQTCDTLLPRGRGGHAMAFDSARARTVLFGAGQTWEFDGSVSSSGPGNGWSRRRTATAPPARSLAGMVYDSWRGRCVLFGGANGVQSLGDTWQYDGTSWSQVFGTGPSARQRHGMAFDAARGRVVMFGGSRTLNNTVHQDTWEFDGFAWTQRFPTHSPSPRDAMAMAYGSGATVIFGGRTPAGISAETWSFDGVDWLTVIAPTAPGRRFDAQMAFDTARRKFVMVGGTDLQILSWQNLGDAWEFDGTTWTMLSATAVTPRSGHAMSFDAGNAELLLLGGTPAPHQLLRSTSGATWSPVAHAEPPPSRERFGLAYDVRRDRTVLFGGTATNGIALSDETWELSGVRWAQVHPPHAPSPRSGAAMTYDLRNGRVVLFGGDAGAALFGDTWVYDGIDWTRLVLPIAPSARTRAGIAHDPARNVVVLYGGTDYQTWNTTDTWELHTNGWVQTIPSQGPAFANDLGMTYDRQRQRVVLVESGSYPWTREYDGTAWVVGSTPAWAYATYGIAYDAARGRTIALPDENAYEFDGTTWTPHLLQEGPTLDWGKLVYDEARGRVVRVGATGETAIYVPPVAAAWARLGPGCGGNGGSAAVPHLDATPPALGTAMQLTLSNLSATAGLAHLGAGFHATHWAGLALPVELAAFGLPGCLLWIDSEPAFGTWLVANGGVAVRTLTIPNVPVFAGLRLFFQGSVLEPNAPGGLLLSNAGVGTLN